MAQQFEAGRVPFLLNALFAGLPQQVANTQADRVNALQSAATQQQANQRADQALGMMRFAGDVPTPFQAAGLPAFAEQDAAAQAQTTQLLGSEGQNLLMGQLKLQGQQLANDAAQLANEQAQALIDFNASPAGQAAAQRKATSAQLEFEKKRADTEKAVLEARNMAMTGGRPIEAWTADKRQIQAYGRGMQQIDDLRVLNRAVGREILPGAEKGFYNSTRGLLLNQLQKLFEAGALQQAEIEFFQTLLPDFGTWSSLSKAQKDQQLRILGDELAARAGLLVDTTKGSVMPEITTRGVAQILGEPEFPPGSVPVESTGVTGLLTAPGEAVVGRSKLPPSSAAQAIERFLVGDDAGR